MGYFSCNSESSVLACDPYNLDTNKTARKKKRRSSASYKIKRFSFNDLASATNGFSPNCFLGKGSHGSVYKALLNNGKLIVAVKRSNVKNDSCTVPPGENEVEILSRVRHPRFVNLLGYSFDSNENKLIVVEYMANGSLYDLLHVQADAPPLSWAKRVRYTLQIARAVEALHMSNPPVIHRDIKSSNVLIDGDWNARLGDFGLALRGHVEDVRIKCTPPAGTLGYLDPGYTAPENLSAKSDVFSFGILVLEIISGRKAIDMNYSPPSVVNWALPLIEHGEFIAICDPCIDPPGDLSVIQQLAILAAKCVRSMAEKRLSMSEVVECLRIVNKRVSSSKWNNLRRQKRKQSSSIFKGELFGSGKEVVVGNKTPLNRSRKVPSIQHSLSVDLGKEYRTKVVDVRTAKTGPQALLPRTSPVYTSLVVRVRRCNSVGSIVEIKGISDTSSVGGQLAPVRKRSAVAAVKLNKSRSLGVLQSTRLVHSREIGFVVQVVKSPLHRGLDASTLVIKVDQALENDIIEKKQST